MVAGFAVAAIAATSAHAAKPLSVKQKNEMAEAKARQYHSQQKTTLRTTTKATLAAPQAGNGSPMAAQLPPELDHYLTASPDANGHMRVRDTDANNSSTVTAVEVSDEI